jgi:hypothetical protein
MSSDAVYAGVNIRVRYCTIYIKQRLGYSEAMPWQKGQCANLGQSGGSSAMTELRYIPVPCMQRARPLTASQLLA